jgi:FlaA1/EpsC-like NDP-sugar epimerase
MTIPEAVRLLIQAGALGERGETFVLDMGQPVRIEALARDLIELSGLRPDFDIPIKITQLQNGEKLREEFLDSDREELFSTRFERVRMVRGNPFDLEMFAERLKFLEAAAGQGNPEGALRILEDFDIGFRSGQVPLPVLAETGPSARPSGSRKSNLPVSRVSLPSLVTARS